MPQPDIIDTTGTGRWQRDMQHSQRWASHTLMNTVSMLTHPVGRERAERSEILAAGNSLRHNKWALSWSTKIAFTLKVTTWKSMSLEAIDFIRQLPFTTATWNQPNTGSLIAHKQQLKNHRDDQLESREGNTWATMDTGMLLVSVSVQQYRQQYHSNIQNQCLSDCMAFQNTTTERTPSFEGIGFQPSGSSCLDTNWTPCNTARQVVSWHKENAYRFPRSHCVTIH